MAEQHVLYNFKEQFYHVFEPRFVAKHPLGGIRYYKITQEGSIYGQIDYDVGSAREQYRIFHKEGCSIFEGKLPEIQATSNTVMNVSSGAYSVAGNRGTSVSSGTSSFAIGYESTIDPSCIDQNELNKLIDKRIEEQLKNA